MSWDWVSVDGGKTFKDIPGLPLGLENHDFGDEGDLALDDANHLYFVDTKLAEDSITRWTVSGLDKISIDFHSVVIPTLEDTKDRPWIIAHGDGHVLFLNNEGNKSGYHLAKGSGGAFGPGRYIVHVSDDGGQTFDPYGFMLKDSGWCRPAADHTPGSKYFYVFCTNDGGSSHPNAKMTDGTLWSYVSADDGHTWSRHEAGIYTELGAGSNSWPTVQVAPDGSIWAVIVDRYSAPTQTIRLFHSVDHGRTWSQSDVTPEPGQYNYAWISVSPDGRLLGLGVYHRPKTGTPWRVFGSVWQPPEIRAAASRVAAASLPRIGTRPALTSLDSIPVTPANYADAPGDFMTSSFNPDGTLGVMYTRVVIPPPHPLETQSQGLFRDIYFARSTPLGFSRVSTTVLGEKIAHKPAGKPTRGKRLPATGVGKAPIALVSGLFAGAALLARRLRLR